MIQIRNVDPELHRRLKEKAAGAGMSLSDYLKKELQELAALKTWQEIFDDMEPYRIDVDIEEIIKGIDEGRAGR